MNHEGFRPKEAANDNIPSSVHEALKEARDIWDNATLPERTEAHELGMSLSLTLSDEQLTERIMHKDDDMRAREHIYFVACALALLMHYGQDA